jgi:hypothetical protein
MNKREIVYINDLLGKQDREDLKRILDKIDIYIGKRYVFAGLEFQSFRPNAPIQYTKEEALFWVKDFLRSYVWTDIYFGTTIRGYNQYLRHEPKAPSVNQLKKAYGMSWRCMIKDVQEYMKVVR